MVGNIGEGFSRAENNSSTFVLLVLRIFAFVVTWRRSTVRVRRVLGAVDERGALLVPASDSSSSSPLHHLLRSTADLTGEDRQTIMVA